MPKIIISEFMDVQAVADLQNDFDVIYDPDLGDQPAILATHLTSAAALIVRNRTQVTYDLLSHAPHLQCVGRLGVGLDNINQEACAQKGIEIYPATGANNLSVAEYVITSTMILLRNAYLSGADMRSGTWPRQQCSGREFAGTCLGLIGYGAIAQKTAEMARALGVKTVAFDPYLPRDHAAWKNVEHCDFQELLKISDAVSLHTPLTDATRHLMDKKAFALMKKEAVLINAARGGVVDEQALVHALKTHQIAGAALDVFEAEPLSEESAKKFQGINNILLTPHIAGVTHDSNQRVSALIAQKVRQHLCPE